MARPAGYQWQPLGWDTDPVPGDPQVIAAEAAYLTATAREIADQVTALSKIATESVQIGQSPDALRASASSLAGQLDKVVGRFQGVAAALRGWGPELEQAQRMSIQALDQAEIPSAKLTQQAILPSGTDLTAAQEQEIAAHAAAMRSAQEQLDAAKALLAKAINLRDTQAAYYQGKINNASNDAMTDSWWDHFSNWVDQHVSIIKNICTVLEFAATILAIAALIVPGLNILVIAGLSATLLALVGRVALAATGNGSWTEVALDAFALATFGAGKIVGNLMTNAFEAAEDTARGLIQVARATSFIGKVGTKLGQAADFIENGAVVRGAASLLERIGLKGLSESMGYLAGTFGGTLTKASAAALEKASASLETTLATVPESIRPCEVALYGGEQESLLMTRKMAAIVVRFPASKQIALLNENFTALKNIQRGIFATANLVDVPDKVATGFNLDHADGSPILKWDIPRTERWREMKDAWATPGGLTTAQANDAVDVLQLIPVAGVVPAGFRVVLGGGW